MNVQNVIRVSYACTCLAFLAACQPDSSQSQQRIRELVSENSKDKARIDLLVKQMEVLAADAKGNSEKLEKLLLKDTAENSSSTGTIEAALLKLSQRLQQASGSETKVKGYADSVTGLLVMEKGGELQTVAIPFAKDAGGDEWAPLLSDGQILSKLSASGPTGEQSSPLRPVDPVARNGRRPPPLRIGDPSPSGTNVEPAAPTVSPESSASPTDSGDRRIIPPSEGGARVTEKDGRRVLRLEP